LNRAKSCLLASSFRARAAALSKENWLVAGAVAVCCGAAGDGAGEASWLWLGLEKNVEPEPEP